MFSICPVAYEVPSLGVEQQLLRLERRRQSALYLLPIFAAFKATAFHVMRVVSADTLA